MSGVEAAGFVFAAFPLLISALEDYRAGWEVIEDWWKIKREYKKCQQNLKLQRLVFEENLEQLLSTFVQDDEELKSLISDPGGDGWRVGQFLWMLCDLLFRSWNKASACCSIRWWSASSGICLVQFIEGWESEIMLDRSNKEGQLANRQGVKGYHLISRENNKNRQMQIFRDPAG